MRVINASIEMQRMALAEKSKGCRIGLVPTMGALHAGHLSLVRRARSESDFTVVSIYVNPTQFGAGEDLKRYPRPFDRDLELCRAEGVDIVFAPDDSIYAPDHSVFVAESFLSEVLCGASRPGHFSGVLTVVAKLFNIVQPDVAVFGQKDAQQAVLIQRMVRDLNFPVRIIVAPVVREDDGLAMSSRNAYLSPDERVRALCLNKSLRRALNMFRDGQDRSDIIAVEMRQIIEQNGGVIDYISIVDSDTLQPVQILSSGVLIAIAVKIGNTRLIDNVIVDLPS